MVRRRITLPSMMVLVALVALAPGVTHATSTSFLGRFGSITTIASTVPANGDVNPYGIAVVPQSVGNLVQGNVLVSNFNAASNMQGTGTTIVEISPGGVRHLFAHLDASTLPGDCPGGVGLTTALVALRSGWVIVGSLPTRDGTAATARAGCLIVLNSWGHAVETFAGSHINGPWDMTAFDVGDSAALFVTNVLNETVAANGAVVFAGTVVRIALSIPTGKLPHIVEINVIGSSFPERTDPAALVIGPTGVALGRNGVLYVADSVDNAIAAIPDALFRESTAMRGATVAEGGALNDPLGLTIAPNGDILTVNGNNGVAVETSPGGTQIATKLLDATGSPPGAGALFGLAVTPNGNGLYYVDDADNTLKLLH